MWEEGERETAWALIEKSRGKKILKRQRGTEDLWDKEGDAVSKIAQGRDFSGILGRAMGVPTLAEFKVKP